MTVLCVNYLHRISSFAAVFHLIAAAVWCDNGGNGCNSYIMTLNTVGAALMAIGGVFTIVVVAGGAGGSSTSPA